VSDIISTSLPIFILIRNCKISFLMIHCW